MNYSHLVKDERILETVNHLTSKFGTGHFKICDYWDADLCAIGFSDNSEKYLVYISTYQKSKNHYFVSFENTKLGNDIPYENAGDFDNVDLQELERLMKEHLRF